LTSLPKYAILIIGNFTKAQPSYTERRGEWKEKKWHKPSTKP